jgi:anti-anti-sigma factor
VNDNTPSIAALSGEVDFTRREALRAELQALREAALAIVDLSDVSYMDSIAIAEILLLQRQRQRAGLPPLRVVVGARIARLYEISGLRTLLPTFRNLDEAKIR